jgi:hypothetical protein
VSSIKPVLAVGALVLDLTGAFLLAIPMLVGVENALRYFLRLRSRVKAQRRRGARQRAELRYKTSDVGKRWVFALGAVDLATDEENIAPYMVLATAAAVLAFFFWQFLDQVVMPYQALAGVNSWVKYPLYVLLGTFELTIAALALMLLYVFCYFGLIILLIGASVPIFGLIGLTIAALSLPARLLHWIIKNDSEAKIGWIGFTLLVTASFVQAALNFML